MKTTRQVTIDCLNTSDDLAISTKETLLAVSEGLNLITFEVIDFEFLFINIKSKGLKSILERVFYYAFEIIKRTDESLLFRFKENHAYKLRLITNLMNVRRMTSSNPKDYGIKITDDMDIYNGILIEFQNKTHINDKNKASISFRDYIKKLINENSPSGDFARDSISLPDFPSNFRSEEHLYDYLFNKNASFEAKEVGLSIYKDFVKKYKNGISLSKKKKSKRHTKRRGMR